MILVYLYNFNILTMLYLLFAEPSASCELYHNGSDICFEYGSIGRDYVFFNKSVGIKDSLNSKLLAFNDTLYNYIDNEIHPAECIDLLLGLMCHHSFPLCDYSSNTPVPRQVCILFAKSC